MPIEHVVLLKPAPDVDPASIAAVASEWQALIQSIPGVLAAALGPLVSPDSKGYSHMAHVRFTNLAAQQAFNPHPQHIATMQLLKGKVADFLIADLHLPA